MKVLHVYDEGDNMARRYVVLLREGLADTTDIREATGKDAAIHAPRDFQPDIVHLHGQATCDIHPARIVLTPHGKHANMEGVYVVIARSPMEYERLKELHPRVETVRNPLITRTITPAECVREHQRIYQRVMHSDVLPLMSSDTRKVLATLLKAAICGDLRWVEPLPSPFPEADFTLLFIYAELEGVLPLVQEGMRVLNSRTSALDLWSLATAGTQELLNSRTPALDLWSLATAGTQELLSACDAYLPVGYHTPEPMPTATFTELVADIYQNGPSLLRLTELDRLLRRDTTDEAQLLQALRRQHRQSFFASILQLMSEQTLLTEGFMPCKPLDNRTTQQLRQQLRNRLKL